MAPIFSASLSAFSALALALAARRADFRAASLASSANSLFSDSTLDRFCGLYPLLSSGGLTGSYNIGGNLSNPTIDDIIAGGPCSAVPLIEELVQIVLGLNLQNGIENILDAKLDAALRALDSANQGTTLRP